MIQKIQNIIKTLTHIHIYVCEGFVGAVGNTLRVFPTAPVLKFSLICLFILFSFSTYIPSAHALTLDIWPSAQVGDTTGEALAEITADDSAIDHRMGMGH